MQNHNIDLLINIQETPEYILEKAQTFQPHPDSNEAANIVLKELQSLIKANQLQLYLFYETAFPTVHKMHFSADKQWPRPNTLQELFDTQYKQGAQNIYLQYAMRNQWQNIKNAKDEEYLDWIDLSWETYSSIFELQSTRISFSPIMIWDYFQSFLQIYMYHNKKNKCNDDIFNPQATKKILTKMSESIPNIIPTTPKSKQYFAYYSLIAHSVILGFEGNYKQGVDLIKRISLKQTGIFSKACGSLLTLFFNTSFCHFMLEDYTKSTKLLQTVIPFYQKNKKYFSKSLSSAQNLQKLSEKICALLCINYVFLEEKPKTSIMDNFKNVALKSKDWKDKVSDAFYKMKQHDLTTFLKLFNFVFAEYQIENNCEIMTKRFKSLQSITLNTFIQNYKRIELKKMSQILKISTSEILNKFKNLQAIEGSKSAWDETIMNPLLSQKKKTNVVIEGDIAIFDSQSTDQLEASRQWERYREEFTWLVEKVKNL